MSSVLEVESNIGQLIIHSTDLVREHRKNKVWEKFSGLADLLPTYPNIPTPHIYFAGLVDKKFMLVQKFSEGAPAGKRILINNIISDVWRTNRTETVRKILISLAAVHNVILELFGWPRLKSGTLKGSYPTWLDFFEIEAPRWIRIVTETDVRLKLVPISNLKPFVLKMVDSIHYDGPAVLVHGDAINPSNILVKDNGNIVFLDWEWSISGDPAWEFGDLGWWSLLNRETFAPYFKARNIEDIASQLEFLHRARIAGFFWLLWGAHMHSHDTKPNIYLALRKLLAERVEGG